MSSDTEDVKKDIKYDRRCLIYGLASVAIFSLMLIFNAFYNENATMRTFTDILGLAYACYLFGYSVYLKKKHNLKLKCNSVATAAVLALFLYAVSDGLVDTCCLLKAKLSFIILGYMFYFIPIILGTFLFKNPRLWYIIMTVLIILFSILQHYILLFRGSIFTVSDFANIKSAFVIKSSYSFKIDIQVIFAILFTCAVIYGLKYIDYSVINIKIRVVSLLSMICVIIFMPFVLGRVYTSSKYDVSFGRTYSPLTSPTYSTGMALMFYYDFMYNILEKPENYNTADAEAIIDKYQSDTYDGKVKIIAILNESWTDFAHIGEVDTNGVDFLKNWHEASENTIKGYTTVSVYGGMTCNSEYEFLTGNSMYFMPNSGIFTNYLDSHNDSIVTHMNELGFDTVSYVPCSEALWNIGEAYDYLGFKTRYYAKDMGITVKDLAPSKKQISDKALYDKLIKTIDERDREHDGPSFYWLTTMQNHAPYDYKYNEHLSLVAPKNKEAESYLNLVYDSDEAFAELTKHYENSDERVVIVMFGDHYPHINDLYDSFSDSKSNNNGVGLYQTPFIIWSNQHIESKWIDDISLNYLSNEVFKAAGVPLSPVQQELEHIREYFPIIASFGYKTKDGEWFEKGDSCKYDDILYEYHVMQWYRMFDEKRRILTSSGH